MNENKQTKTLLSRLRQDERSLLYANEVIANTLVKKFLKSTYLKNCTVLHSITKLKLKKMKQMKIIHRKAKKFYSNPYALYQITEKYRYIFSIV